MTSDLLKIINRVMGTKQFLLGGSDGTLIGNSGDALKTTSSVLDQPLNSKLRIDVLTTPITLVANTYTNVYTYTGSGLLIGLNLEFNNTSIIVRLKVDGEIVLDGVSLSTLNSLLATANNAARYQSGAGIITNSSAIDISFRKAIKYATSIVIDANANSGLLARTFNQGIVYIQKET